MIQKLKTSVVVLTMAAGLSSVFIPVAASADTAPLPACPTGYDHPLDANGKPLVEGCSKDKLPGECPSGAVDGKDPTKCKPLGNSCDQKTGICSGNPIVEDLNKIVNVLAGLVGVVVVGSIILGGIQYATAGDKAEAVSAAKKRIINGLIALLGFLFIYAFLQWLIPGGIFK